MQARRPGHFFFIAIAEALTIPPERCVLISRS